MPRGWKTVNLPKWSVFMSPGQNFQWNGPTNSPLSFQQFQLTLTIYKNVLSAWLVFRNFATLLINITKVQIFLTLKLFMVDILENVPFFKEEQTEKIQEMGPWRYQFFSVSNRFRRRTFKACPGFIMFRCSRKKTGYWWARNSEREMGIGHRATGNGQRARGSGQRATENRKKNETNMWKEKFLKSLISARE